MCVTRARRHLLGVTSLSCSPSSLGLLSKPMLVTTPFVLLFLDYWPLRRFAQPSAIGRIFLEKIPLLALSTASSVATLLAHKQAIASVGELGLSWRLSNAVVSCLTYLWQMIWPVRLAPFYPHLGNQLPLWEITLAALLIISITGAALLLRKRQPYFFTGWFWYLVMLVPVLGIIQVGMQAHADRYTYLPHVGLYILITWMISDTISWRPLGRPVLAVGAAIVITVLAWQAGIQTSYWHESETLWTHTLMVTQDNDVAHTGLGDILFARGKVEEATSEFRTALYLRPNSASAHRNLGVALLKSGAVDEAIDHLDAALRINPDYPAADLNLGNAFLQKGQLEAALDQYEKAVALQPDDVAARCNLATALFRKGDLDQAIAQYQKTIETRPDYAEAHYNLGNCYARKGEIEHALNQYEETLKFSPDNPEAHNNLGVVLSQKGKVKEAITQWEEALRIQPDKIDAQNNLAWILATSSNKSVRDGAKALNLIQRAQQLSGSGDPKILRTLAAAYAETGRFQEATETARQGLELANAQGNTSLVNTFETDLARYRTNLPLGAP
jgi:protein O-mannosyl-transferase